MNRLALLVLIVAAAVGAVAGWSGATDDRVLVDHGAYMVSRAALCVDCHNTRTVSGTVDEKKVLSGAPIIFRPTVKIDWAEYAPNLTPGGPLKSWTAPQLVKFLMTGVDPSGQMADQPMPQYRFTQRDAESVAAYLRRLPTIKSEPAAGTHQHEH